MLCEMCKKDKRKLCIAQELWNENEKQFDAIHRQIENDWMVRDYDPKLKKAHDDAVQELIKSRSKAAKTIKAHAERLGCTNLKVLPFAT